MKGIIEPYLSGKSFKFKGRVFKSSDVADFIIKRTLQKVSEIIIDHYEDFVYGTNVTNILLKRSKKEENRTLKMPTLQENVFIVHGRDHKPMKELKVMVKGFGLNPIVLHEQPSGSRTIIEKLEKYLDEVGYAFVILTPDDMGCLRDKFLNYLNVSLFKKGESEANKNDKARFFFREVPKLLMNRARQNVMLEFGCCIARLGRERVCCLYKRYVELPSDMHGILQIRFKESVNEVKGKIVKELKAAGYEIMGQQ